MLIFMRIFANFFKNSTACGIPEIFFTRVAPMDPLFEIKSNLPEDPSF